jgi:hypothetical protein
LIARRLTWCVLVIGATAAAHLVACALDFDRYDPVDAAAETQPTTAIDAGSACAPSPTCIRTASACASGCRTQSRQCVMRCTGAACGQACAMTEQTCVAQCTTTCASCTERAGCAGASDCLDAAGGG